LESENHECPTCHEINVSPDNLIPNRFLRISVAKFKNDTGYKKDKYFITDQTKQSLIETKDVIDNKDLIETNTDVVEMKTQLSPGEQKSPVQSSSDVTMDEVILGSPKKEELTKKPDEPQSVIKPTVVSNEVQSQDLKETNDNSNEE
jgi:E3 ubiquitin-protein ligase RBBP6